MRSSTSAETAPITANAEFAQSFEEVRGGGSAAAGAAGTRRCRVRKQRGGSISVSEIKYGLFQKSASTATRTPLVRFSAEMVGAKDSDVLMPQCGSDMFSALMI